MGFIGFREYLMPQGTRDLNNRTGVLGANNMKGLQRNGAASVSRITMAH